jgi:integrase
MNPEHVSVEGQEARIPIQGIDPTQRLPVFPSWTPSQSVSEESQERRSKQKIIDRALQKITARGLCGAEPVKAYLTELYRRDCRPNTLRTHAATILSFLLYLKDCGEDRLEGIGRETIGGFVEHEQDRGSKPSTISTRLRGLYSFLKFVVHRGELSADVLTRKLRIKLPQSLPRAIDPQAVRQMLAVIDHPRDRAIVWSLRTGMRIGELLDTARCGSLRAEDRDHGSRKTAWGVVYLSEDACEALRSGWYIGPRKVRISFTVRTGCGLAMKPSAAGLNGIYPKPG